MTLTPNSAVALHDTHFLCRNCAAQFIKDKLDRRAVDVIGALTCNLYANNKLCKHDITLEDAAMAQLPPNYAQKYSFRPNYWLGLYFVFNKFVSMYRFASVRREIDVACPKCGLSNTRNVSSHDTFVCMNKRCCTEVCMFVFAILCSVQ
jgi:hypothetical protein